MQLVQELKFAYDTTVDPEIDKAVEALIYLLQSKDLLIRDTVRPIRNNAVDLQKQLTSCKDSV